ncbi:MAG: (Fe-S)-binding protein, partial [Aestuariivirgaceae bacterium]|nr:(Fe-S)-binding protein [Aestuariivirgaceae bacterium]
MNAGKPRVGLFVTCLVDLMRPSVGFAAVKLLEDAGCVVEAPEAQVCCGQPAYNAGDRATTAAIAKQVIEAFKGYDYVVAPSGSCAGMISEHFPALFAEGTPERAAAEELAARTHELVAFLTRIMEVKSVAANITANVTYHDSCSGLRELKIKDEPR